MLYERQKTLQKELDARIPRGLRGEPQNTVRHIVYSQRVARKEFWGKRWDRCDFCTPELPQLYAKDLTV